jgi:hypothetical protein
MFSNDRRFTARATTDFFLRHVTTVASLFDGDFITGLVFVAIGAANNRKIQPGKSDGAGRDAEGSDNEWTPIPVAALSRTLGLPYETTRRHVAKLIERGACVRTDEGLVLTQEAVESEPVVAAFKKSNADVRWLISALRRGRVNVDRIR